MQETVTTELNHKKARTLAHSIQGSKKSLVMPTDKSRLQLSQQIRKH